MGRYEYDAWGNVIKIEDIYYDSNGNQVTADLTNNTTSRDLLIVNPIRYRGYYYDVETKFYYLQSRYYNPEVGRFLNSDSISDSGAGVLGFNTFIYCANNPVNATDPSGHSIIGAILLGAAVSAVVSGVSDAVCQLMGNGWKLKEIDRNSVVRSMVIGGVCGAISGGIGGAVSNAALGSVTKGVVSAGVDTVMNVVQDAAVSISSGSGYSVSQAGQALIEGAISSVVGFGFSQVAQKINAKSFSQMSNGAKKQYLNVNSYDKHYTRADVRAQNYLKTNAYYDYISFRSDFMSYTSSSSVTLAIDFFNEEREN